MKLIEKYIFKQLFPTFILGNVFFVFLLLIDKMVSLSDLVLTKNVPFYFVVELIIYYIPSFLVLTIPTSGLLAALIVYGTLSDDSELVAMKSLSIPKILIYRPVLIFGIVAMCLAFSMSGYLMPKGNEMAIKTLFNISKFVSLKDFRENELYNEIPNFVLFTKKKRKKKYESLIILDKRKNIIISAREGEIINTGSGSLVFNLREGVLINMGRNIPSKIEFSNFIVNLPVVESKKISVKNERLMRLSDLIKNFDKNNVFKFEFSSRFALPFASVIMAIFGAVFGSFFHRGGKTFGMITSIVIVLIYNTIYLLSRNTINMIPPFLAPWIANFIFIIFSVIMLKKV